MARPTIVRGSHIKNRSMNGHRTYKPLRHFIRYLTLGRLTEQAVQSNLQRGSWFDQGGTLHSQAQVEQWAKEKVHRLRYDHAYQLLLSTGKGGLDSADFNAALQAGSHISNVYEWRMMIHTDTRNQHAHAILFRHEPLSKKAYLAWQQTMQQTLDKRQMARLLEQEQALNQQTQHSMSIEQRHSEPHNRSWGIDL